MASDKNSIGEKKRKRKKKQINKRKCDIKDYGNIMPGHGGVLDRYDSIIFVAPIVFYLLQMTA